MIRRSPTEQNTRTRPASPRVPLLAVLGASVLLTVAGAGLIIDRLAEDERCETGDETGVRLSGLQRSRYEDPELPKGTVIDARTARWEGREPHVVVIRGGEDLCLTGGSVQGRWPPRTSWDVMHGTSAIVLDVPRVTVEDLRIDGYGDSIVFVYQSRDFVVRRVHLSDNRDDCIENDWLHSGTVQDALLDGCYNAFSSRTYDTQEGVTDGGDNVWTIRDSLVRLQPMQRPYKDRGPIPGTAGFFKWDALGPRLSLHGIVFRADQPSNTVGLGLPEGKLESCSDNVMVWLGDGAYPEELPSCFSVTNDVQIWDDAVAEWKDEHGY